MTDKEFQSLPQPRPPIGFPATAPPDFAIPHEVTKFQRGGKKLIHAIRKRFQRTREADAVSSARRS
jgi:hypothetical protein